MTANWFSVLESPDYQSISRDPGVTDSDVTELARFFGRPLPADYAAFLRVCGGGELSFRDIWTIRLWRPADIPSWLPAYGFPKWAPEAKVIGDNGGGEALVFDTRPVHIDGDYPIYAMNFVSITWDAIIYVAKSFTDLMWLQHPLLG